MSFLTNVQGVIQTVTIIRKVFIDNRGSNVQRFERNLTNVPYADIVENFDSNEHTDITRRREGTIDGIILALKERDVYQTIVDQFFDAFKGQDQMDLSMDKPSDFSVRLYQISFSVTGFESVSK